MIREDSDSYRFMGTFERKFFDARTDFTTIGTGSLGGKASGLVRISEILEQNLDPLRFPGIQISIPRMTVLATDVFIDFMEMNNLQETALSDLSDDRIAHAFQNTSLPPRIVGDLYALISQVRSPLAIRSSSLLEDAMYEPFAGIYGTKMTPNNQFDTETRFAKLIEAIKFVYSSVYFQAARDYFKATHHELQEEKMAVIIQEVVGQRHADRFYPDISGVARSYNFYPVGHARPEEGIVSLALGLGKMIVDDGISWSYSPAYPRANPPYSSIDELMKQTQRSFWAVNMARIPAYDPVKETEYLIKIDLTEAERDETLRYLVSTYNPGSDRIYPGTTGRGPRVLNFAPILHTGQIPLNDLIRELLHIAENSLETPVEIEFAVTLDPKKGLPARFGFLQIRPMVVSQEKVEISREEMEGQRVLAVSESVLGNGMVQDIRNVLYVKPDSFDSQYTRQIAAQVEALNRIAVSGNFHYLLIGFGRWGSSDPWLGIPANWGQISNARVIVESTLPEMNVDLSQGSHFFHNLSSFQISYFSLKHSGKYQIDWDWLNSQTVLEETEFVKLVKLSTPLTVKVDGRTGRGVILK